MPEIQQQDVQQQTLYVSTREIVNLLIDGAEFLYQEKIEPYWWKHRAKHGTDEMYWNYTREWKCKKTLIRPLANCLKTLIENGDLPKTLTFEPNSYTALKEDGTKF